MEQQAVDEDRTKRARGLGVGASAALIVASFWFVLPLVAVLSDVWRQVTAIPGVLMARLV